MPKKFLVIRWSGMGDVVMTLPALKWLKENFDNCHISYVTDTGFSKILEHSENVDKIEAIDRRGFKEKNRFFSALFGALKLICRLYFHPQKEFDVVFDLQGFGETAILSFLTGAPIRVGRTKESFLRKKIYNSFIKANWELEHRTRYFVRAVSEACGHSAPEIIPAPTFPKIATNRKINRRLVGFNIGSSTESRRWSESNFIELAKRISKRGFEIRFFLGPQDKFLIPKIKNVCDEYNWDLSYDEDLNIINTISECLILISNDTGPGHIAAAMGLPIITLFSTTDPDNAKPLTDKAVWFRNENDINMITVSEVEKGFLELLNY
ncbi:MAG: glycosyltransferase family 9 protein [Desulfobacterales bacterium]|nr:glycosyltransferase family 9 protein [Desulfobacterales bacterium]